MTERAGLRVVVDPDAQLQGVFAIPDNITLLRSRVSATFLKVG